MGAAEVEGFLTHLAVNRQVVAATQNQALDQSSSQTKYRGDRSYWEIAICRGVQTHKLV